MTDLIGFPRWTKEITFTGGSWLTDYPVTNLASLPFSRVARSINTLPASTKFRADFAQERLAEIIVLCRHNLSLSAQWRIQLFEYAGDVAPVFDSGIVNVWPAVFDDTSASWDAGNFWDRRYTEAQIAGYPWHTPMFIVGGYTVAAFSIEILDEDNPDGFVQIGLCEASAALPLPLGTAFGAQLGFQSRTVVTEADSGVEYFERRQKARTFNGQLSAVERSTSLGSFYELYRQNDVETPFFWWPSRENARDTLRTAFMARFQQLDPITQAYTAHDALNLSLKEML